MTYEGVSPYSTKNLMELLEGPTEFEWVVENLIPPQSTVIMAGPGGTGKTWLGLDLALSIALGIPWLGVHKVTQGKILLVDEENAEILLRLRLMYLLEGLKAKGIDTSLAYENLSLLVAKMVNLSPDRLRDGSREASVSYKMLYNTISEIRPELVIFDSLTRVHTEDENKNIDMAQLFKYIKKICNELGTSILLTHHFTKNGKLNDAASIRGAGDITNFADSTCLVVPFKDCVKVTQHKNRWSMWPIPTTIVKINYDQINDAVSFECDVTETNLEADKEKIWKMVEKFLEGNQGSALLKEIKSELIKQVKWKGRWLDDFLSSQVDQLRLIKDKVGREVRYSLYSANDWEWASSDLPDEWELKLAQAINGKM